jgi:hypothetical protein
VFIYFCSSPNNRILKVLRKKISIYLPQKKLLRKGAIAGGAAVAGQHVVIKKYLTDSDNSVGSEVLLSATSKFVADQVPIYTCKGPYHVGFTKKV